VDEILKVRPSKLKFFTFFGALSGTITGFAFTIYTVLRWPLLITGGKPIVSIPPFVIIAFELTILFGAIATFLGFLILSRSPNLKKIISPKECGNNFLIIVDDGDPK
ncbi:MAG: quinol:electron acceptor oxidoreductase subunit ActD, partial [bacterium]|nr:quinol:electron acceptor oxidoreductase subunit ActD [bacterium]